MEITHFIKNALEANVPECLGGELFTCDQCNYTSKWNSAMRYHTQTALEAKVPECLEKILFSLFSSQYPMEEDLEPENLKQENCKSNFKT